MNFLDKIIDEINAIEDSIFEIDEDTLEEIMNRIEDINFLGQVDHDVLYMGILHQINKNNEIHTLTKEESEEFYLTGKIKKFNGWKPFTASFWFFNMETNYIRGLVSYKPDFRKDVKENYATIYNELKPEVYTKLKRKVIYQTKINESGYEEIWTKLKTVIIYGKNNTINTGNFAKKISYPTSKFFGIDKTKIQSNEYSIIDDEFKETLRPEMIFVSKQKYKPQNIENDKKIINLMKGTSFLQIDFEGDGYIKEFENIPQLNSYLYSLIQFINDSKIMGDQEIKTLEKHYKSNKPGFSNSEKFYKLKFTKFLKKLVIEAEIQEFGIYYTISNFNGQTFCDCL